VPALSFSTSGPGQTQLTLRGVTAGNDIGPTVGVYVNDVPYGSSTAFTNASSLSLDAGLFDMDRIEVLRGPQGTLYGASTMGGLIKYVTAAPELDVLSGSAQAGVSDTRHGGISYNGAAAINAPIVSDKIALRANGFYSQDGGFIDNLALGRKDVNRSRVYGGRADLLLKPTDALSIRIGGYIQNIHRDGTAAADYTLAGEPVDTALDQRRLLAGLRAGACRRVRARFRGDSDRPVASDPEIHAGSTSCLQWNRRRRLADRWLLHQREQRKRASGRALRR
jgi:outer membrane receptor protein involved in Fe transport